MSDEIKPSVDRFVEALEEYKTLKRILETNLSIDGLWLDVEARKKVSIKLEPLRSKVRDAILDIMGE